MDNKKVEKLRDDISKILKDLDSAAPSRVKSLVVTKLEEAQMWAGNLFSKDKTDGIIKRS